MQTKVISVFGSSAPQPETADYELARQVGYQLARAGFSVQTGGYGGMMAGASQGAHEGGGHVIGVTSARIETFRQVPANQWVAEEIKHQTLRDRVFYLVEKCDGAVVLPGGIGTISEMALIWSMVQVGEISPRPIVLLGGLWERTLAAFNNSAYIQPHHYALLTQVRTPGEAVQALERYFQPS